MFASSEEIEPTVIQRERFFQAGFTLRQTLFSGSTLPGLRAANRMVDASLMDEARNTQQVKLQAAAAFQPFSVAASLPFYESCPSHKPRVTGNHFAVPDLNTVYGRPPQRSVPTVSRKSGHPCEEEVHF